MPSMREASRNGSAPKKLRYNPNARYKVKSSWECITDDFGNLAWWHRCSNCARWRVIESAQKPSNFYCNDCNRERNRRAYRELEADQARHMEYLETRRLKHFDRKTSQGFTVNHATGKHRLRYPFETKREMLPVGPMRHFVLQKVDRPFNKLELAQKWGLDEKAIHRIIRGSQFITFDQADQILTREGLFVWDLYPKEYDEMLQEVVA